MIKVKLDLLVRAKSLAIRDRVPFQLIVERALEVYCNQREAAGETTG